MKLFRKLLLANVCLAFTAAPALADPVSIGSFIISSLLSVGAGGNLRVDLRGKLVHVDASSDHMFNFGTRDVVQITGNGEIDGQQADQTDDRIIFPISFVRDAYVTGVGFRNIKKGAVHQQNPAVSERFVVEFTRHLDGGLHDGTPGGQACQFILVRGGRFIKIWGNQMKQTADPLPNQNRNPAGIVFINTGSGPICERAIVGWNVLENLGHSSSGNHLGPIDCYNWVEQIEIFRNTLKKSRWHPIRTNYTKIARVAYNTIHQDVPMYLNDVTPYAGATLIAINMVDRGYPSDTGETSIVELTGNHAVIDGDLDIDGWTISNGTTEGLMHIVKSSHNFLQHKGTNAANGVFINNVKEYVSEDDDIIGFQIGERMQQTSNIAPLSAEPIAKATLRGGSRKGGNFGFWADLDVANLDVVLDGVGFSGQANQPYRVRNAKSLKVTGCAVPAGKSGDAQNNGSVVFEGNPGATVNPVGITTNGYWKVSGVGLPDWEAGNRKGVTTLSVDQAEVLDPTLTCEEVVLSATLTAQRNLSLSTTNAVVGKTRFRISRPGGGAFNWAVGGSGVLKQLPTGTWCDVVYGSGGYYLAAYGSL